MQTEIVHLPALNLVGFAARFISALSPEANNLKVIPPLWDQLMSRRRELGVEIHAPAYGACRPLRESERRHSQELEYLAGFALERPPETLPEGMTLWRVEPATYVRFTHRGPVANLQETITYVYDTWLPASGQKRADGVEFELYDEKFRGNAPDSELGYFVPLAATSVKAGAEQPVSS